MANQITYEQAMAQLTTMFPHVEKDVVAFLLESNKYHVERTVETLLSMTSTKPSTPVANTSSSHHEHKQGRSQLAKTIQTRSGTLNLAIQDDFLRPPNYFSRRSGNASSPLQQGQDGSHLSQIDQDALLAAMLQDELFMQDLAQHPERYMGAEQHVQPIARPVNRSPVPTSHTGPLQNVSATSAAIATQGNKPDISGFGSHPAAPDNISKWSSLTSAAKAKLASLAAKFKSDQHSKQLQESELGKVAPNQPYHALSSNLDESLLGPSHDNAPRDDDFSLDDDELPTSPHAAGAEVEMKERGRTTRTSR